MRKRIVAASALAGSLLFAPLMVGPTQAGGVSDLKTAIGAHDSFVTLVEHGGGGGGGGGHAMSGGPSGHVGAMVHGGGSREFSGRSNGPRFAEGREGRLDHGYAGRYVEDRGRGDRFEHRDRRFAERGDRDFDNFHHRHGRLVNGVWIWGYGSDYYAYDYYGGNCWSLRRRALATGNPYWWDRYNDCVGYY